ncbi:1,4-dihydroxy-2-naphthoate octaprenyltransferase [Rubritalea marina]|uniref:1,4-dihydroxy-2-naphthoate octaprenyltransferase n=1 Tax=Rubritalea marina TaxID=361055 RepID=UPI001461586B|nr:1,4-dihydroxy-2-naphthoate octaprenyltransferase [Rubritalea marina]
MIQSCVLAARPKTLPAAIVPVVLGCSLAWELEGVVDFGLAFATLMGAIWIQIATNFFNDAIDNDKGADNERRLGPMRVTSSGLLSRGQVYLIAGLCLSIATFFGVWLYLACGWQIIAIGLPSLYLCYGYTGGPVPLAYRGLGELFVVGFFGVIAVSGTVFVQLGTWPPEAMVLGVQAGLLSAVLISINNLRDAKEDVLHGKRTLAVKLGVSGGKAIIVIELVAALAMGLVWWSMGYACYALASLAIVPLMLPILYKVLREEPSAKFNAYLALGGMQLLLFGVAFAVASIIE